VAVASKDCLRPSSIRIFDGASYVNVVSQMSIGAVGGGDFVKETMTLSAHSESGVASVGSVYTKLSTEVGLKSTSSQLWAITRGLTIVACRTHGSMLALRSPI
jgi:hypothetical protein